MGTIIKIAWRNIWRNKLRSSIVIISMILGLWSGLFTVAMSRGVNEQRVKSAIDTYLHHVQIHNPSFEYNLDINSTIDKPLRIFEYLERDSLVKKYSGRVIVSSMASSAHGSQGIKLIGINSDFEKNFSDISQNIVRGSYFSMIKSKPVVIGEKLANSLSLDLKKKVSFTFVDDNGDLQRVKFKVEGIYKSANSIFDAGTVYVKKEDLMKILYNKSSIHEIAVILNNIDNSEILKEKLLKLNGNNKVETWKDLSPELGSVQELMVWFFLIFMSIILLALSFGIANIMLMAVLERKRELGMLMSVGLNKTKIFLMILFETIFISFIALPIGILLSYIMISYYGKIGIDLSIVSKGLDSFGMKSMVYTSLPMRYYVMITFLTLTVTLISSLFPARRALKLDPAQAVKSL